MAGSFPTQTLEAPSLLKTELVEFLTSPKQIICRDYGFYPNRLVPNTVAEDSSLTLTGSSTENLPPETIFAGILHSMVLISFENRTNPYGPVRTRNLPVSIRTRV